MSFDTLRNVHQALNGEPQTPNKIADKLKFNLKYSSLLEPANTMKHVCWKKIEWGLERIIHLEHLLCQFYSIQILFHNLQGLHQYQGLPFQFHL
jgi:hypothetical protein